MEHSDHINIHFTKHICHLAIATSSFAPVNAASLVQQPPSQAPGEWCEQRWGKGMLLQANDVNNEGERAGRSRQMV